MPSTSSCLYQAVHGSIGIRVDNRRSSMHYHVMYVPVKRFAITCSHVRLGLCALFGYLRNIGVIKVAGEDALLGDHQAASTALWQSWNESLACCVRQLQRIEISQ